MAGITSYGAYIPYYRLPRAVIGKAWRTSRGQGEKAVANHDEDPITMSVAAARNCMEGIDPASIDGLFMATTTAPYAEGHNSTIVSTALDLPRNIRNADFANCLRSGTAALLSAIDAVVAGSARNVLVTAADMRMGGPTGANEQNFGDGSAAFLIGNENVAVEFLGSYVLSDNLLDNWRAQGDTFVRSWEERFGLEEGYGKIPVEAAKGVMNKCGLSPGDFSRICLYGQDSRRQAELARTLGFERSQIQDPLLDKVGNTGSALALMILAGALEGAKPGDRILLVGYGNGADAIVLSVTPEIEKIRDRHGISNHLKARRTLEDYNTYLRWRGLVPTEPAMRPAKDKASMSSLWRENRSALPLYGAKCKMCGTAQLFMDFVSTRARVCLKCHAKDEFEKYRFADRRGKVVTFSHDYLAGSSDPPSTLAVVDFEGGGRGQFLMTDRNPEECRIGMTVEMTFRKLLFDEGVHNYFWKCKPVTDQTGRS